MRNIAAVWLLFLCFLCSWSSFPTNMSIAQQGYADTVSRFWWGSAANGHIIIITNSGASVPGFTPPVIPGKGQFWELAQTQNVLYSYWELTGSTDALARMKAEWQWVKSFWSLSDVSACGVGTTSTAQDDAAWGAMALVQLYDATNDALAASYAQGMLDCAWNRWEDTTTGGGLWYSDADAQKSSYQAPYALASLHYYQLTGNATYLTRATSIDTWASTVLARTGLDGLYWEGVGPTGTPIGNTQPYQIAMTNSVVFLAGNMAFAALDAELYALCTGNASLCPSAASTYLARARATASSIRTYEVVSGTNILLDDRDAFTNGWAAAYYARFVVPDLTGTSADATTLAATAFSVFLNDRNNDATYGGDWQGPVDGVWYAQGSTNYQSKVAAQGATLEIASAFVNP